MKKFLTVLTVVLLAGCGSKRDVHEELDKTLDTNLNDKGERVGLRDNEIVIQKRVSLEQNLAKLKNEVIDLENAIYGASRRNPGGLWEGLRDCRKRISDPRVGGTGKPEPMERWEKISEKDEEFDFKVDKKRNTVVGISEEAMQTRLDRLKTQKTMLEERYDQLRDKLETCDDNYRSALVDHGLNPNDTKARGEWVDGPNGYKVWKMRQNPTQDPEELMKRKQKRETKSVDSEEE